MKLRDGRDLGASVVGHGPHRAIQTGVGPPGPSARGARPGRGRAQEKIQASPWSILPEVARRTEDLDALLQFLKWTRATSRRCLPASWLRSRRSLSRAWDPATERQHGAGGCGAWPTQPLSTAIRLRVAANRVYLQPMEEATDAVLVLIGGPEGGRGGIGFQ